MILEASADELRKMASFLLTAADHMDSLSDKYDHEHLPDALREFQSSPHFVGVPSSKHLRIS